MLEQSQNFFHLDMFLGGVAPSFLCFIVYGPTVWKEKSSFWNELQQLNRDEHQPWFCMGDFNDILCSAEKQGGRLCSSSSSGGLSHFIQSMGFVDLGFLDSKFTWCNK